MKVGIVGLGRMGNAIAQRAVDGGHEVIGFDPSHQAQVAALKVGVTLASTLEEVARQTRVIWLMVPVGDPVDRAIKELLPHLKGGDIIIDGGNSFYKDSIERAQALALQDIIFLDCGTSGGLGGRLTGFCLMLGGDKVAYTKVHSLLTAIAAPGGLGHFGSSGAGHYVKMVHNGIEYALLQAYAEGFHIIKDGHYKDEAIDLEEVSRVWNHGSVIRSWILGLANEVFKEDQELENVVGEIAEGGTGRWTVDEARQHTIPVPQIESSLNVREWSRKTGGNYTTKVVAMLRNKFGGHNVKKKK